MPPKSTKPKSQPAKGKGQDKKKAADKPKGKVDKSKGKQKGKDVKAKGKAAKGKKVVAEKPKPVQPTSIWEKKPRNFGIGNDIQPKRDVTRFTKWPRYVVLQRKRRVLQQRLKVPPVLNQFTKTLDQNTAANVFALLNKYRPEDKAAKRARLLKAAKEGNNASAKPLTVKCGINHVTKLIEEKKAALVVIAHDVDPIELVLYLPALCRKQDVPFCFVKGKARLGQVVHKKTATALVLTNVRQEDRQQFSNIVQIVRSQYNDKYEELKKTWGGGIMGKKSQAIIRKREKAKAKDAQDKLKYT
jgi:large subunit ribosomal protein L7Ae